MPKQDEAMSLGDHDFGKLPDVTLLKIFSFLKVGDLCKAGSVCARWRIITKSSILWKHVDVEDKQLTAQQMQKLALVLPPSVQHLRVCGCSTQHRVPFLPPHVAKEIRERCPQLHTIVIESAFLAKQIHFTDLNVDDLPQKLLVLSLRKCFFHPDQFFCRPHGPSKVQILDCSACWCLKDFDMPFFTRLSHLQEIYLAGCSITDVGSRLLINLAPNLKVIDLERTHIGDETVSLLLKSSVPVQKLFIGNNDVSDYSLLLMHRDSLPELTELCLARTNVTHYGLRNVIHCLNKLKCFSVGEGHLTPAITSLLPTWHEHEITHALPNYDKYCLIRSLCSNIYSLGYCDHFSERKYAFSH